MNRGKRANGQATGIRRFFRMLGPGLITGASDDDPSGIGTYAIAGASVGYAALWTAPLTFPLMAGIQLICARIGLVSGEGLAGVMRRYYSRRLTYLVIFTLVVANTLNAAADLAAVAAGMNLLIPIRVASLIFPIGVSILILQIWGSYRFIAKTFKWLTLSLLAYIGASVLAGPDWHQVIRGTLIPTVTFDRKFLMTLVAVLGTTISPYLFFWQASEEVEEEIAHGAKTLWQRKGATDRQLRYATWDVNVGMGYSNVVMYFIILATAATLHRAGRTDITTAAEAAQALRPLAGETAFILMGLALIGSGMLAIPILTGSAAYALAETFGWRSGLDEKPGRAPGFYLAMGVSTVAALFMNYFGINLMKALLSVAVIYGFLSPPLLFVIMLIANNPHVMGTHVNGPALNVLGWTTTLIMFVAAIALMFAWGNS